MRIYVFCPDDPRPSGGLRYLYRHVDILRAAGLNACIVHGLPGFRLQWFPNDTPVTYQTILNVEKSDWVVLPETMMSFARMGVGKVVVLNQNTYNLFSKVRGREGYQRATAMICTSARDYGMCRELFEELPIERTFYGIDTSTHYRSGIAPREKIIACMPRKLPYHEAFLTNAVQANGWRWVSIDKMDYLAVAREMRAASIFISLSHDESFGLPPLEAAVCGCQVVGYDGVGGAEYFERFPDNFIKVPQNDNVALLRALKRVMSDGSWAIEPPEMDHEYTREKESHSAVRAWEKILSL